MDVSVDPVTEPAGAADPWLRPLPADLARGLARTTSLVILLLLAATAPVVFFFGRDMLDLDVYRAGGSAVLHGRTLYGDSFGDSTPLHLEFTYPAFAGVIMTPLALIPRAPLGLLWTLAELWVTNALVTRSFRPLLVRCAERRGLKSALLLRLALCAALVWACPIRDHLGFGQIDLFLMALVAADLMAAEPRWPRGALIGLATAIKLVPAVFIGYLLVTGRRREAACATVTAGLATAVSFVVVPHEAVTYWTSKLFDTGRIGDTAYFSNQSLRGMFLRVLPSAPATACWLLAGFVITIVGYRRARALFAGGQETRAMLVVAFIGIALSPISWIHHLVWVVAALGVLVADGSRARTVVTAAALAVLLWSRLPYHGGDFPSSGLGGVVGQLATDSYGLACLALLLFLPVRRATLAAKTPAPYPLSMLTTTTPGAHDESIPASAAKPPAPTP